MSADQIRWHWIPRLPRTTTHPGQLITHVRFAWRRRRSLFRIVYARGAIPNEMGPTHCRATPALTNQPTRSVYLKSTHTHTAGDARHGTMEWNPRVICCRTLVRMEWIRVFCVVSLATSDLATARGGTTSRGMRGYRFGLQVAPYHSGLTCGFT